MVLTLNLVTILLWSVALGPTTRCASLVPYGAWPLRFYPDHSPIDSDGYSGTKSLEQDLPPAVMQALSPPESFQTPVPRENVEFPQNYDVSYSNLGYPFRPPTFYGNTTAEGSALIDAELGLFPQTNPGPSMPAAAPFLPAETSSFTPFVPYPMGALAASSYTSGGGMFYWEYAYDQAEQMRLWSPFIPLVATHRVLGYRMGPFWGFGIFLDVPPWFGFGVVRSGQGFNIMADLIAMSVTENGHKRAAAGPPKVIPDLPPSVESPVP